VYEVVEGLSRELSARELAERLMSELRDFLDGLEPQDDVTILVLKVLERAESPTRSSGRPEAVAAR
jgi:hypothetical protein